MSEGLRGAAIAVASATVLLVVAIGLGAAFEAQETDWGMLVAGIVLFLGVVVPLLLAGRQRRRRRRADRRTPLL